MRGCQPGSWGAQAQETLGSLSRGIDEHRANGQSNGPYFAFVASILVTRLGLPSVFPITASSRLRTASRDSLPAARECSRKASGRTRCLSSEERMPFAPSASQVPRWNSPCCVIFLTSCPSKLLDALSVPIVAAQLHREKPHRRSRLPPDLDRSSEFPPLAQSVVSDKPV